MIFIKKLRANDINPSAGKQYELGRDFLSQYSWEADTHHPVTINYVRDNQIQQTFQTSFTVRGSQRGGTRAGIDCKEYANEEGITPLKDFLINTLHLTSKHLGSVHIVLEDKNEEGREFNLYTTPSVIPVIVDAQVPNDIPLQQVYYGAPGTGKSFKIDKCLADHNISPSDVRRVTFYPDYYYSDFVGGLKPISENGNVKYKFQPGPFAEALKDAFFKPSYLVIEEINRGNAAAIFGDIFQLLDRKNGISKYRITNEDLYSFLCDGTDLSQELNEGEIYIPSNLHILCTMNTADQNVFVLDTAFKRRFRMEYVPIDFSVFDVYEESLAPYLQIPEETDIFAAKEGFRDVHTIINDMGINGIVNPRRNWSTFAKYTNAIIDKCNKQGANISEDKKLGPFFVSPEELIDRKKFADKVLFYLKQDVFKYEESILSDSYELLYERYALNGEDLFTIFTPQE